MKYDDASWHTGDEFPENSPEEYAATHIALFLKWCFKKGWAGDLHLTEAAEDTQRLIEGSLSATEFFLRYCDGTLTDEDLNVEGNAFASQYYGEQGLYLEDYAEHFGDLMFEVAESEHDFELFSSVLESRLQSGELTENS